MNNQDSKWAEPALMLVITIFIVLFGLGFKYFPHITTIIFVIFGIGGFIILIKDAK